MLLLIDTVYKTQPYGYPGLILIIRLQQGTVSALEMNEMQLHVHYSTVANPTFKKGIRV